MRVVGITSIPIRENCLRQTIESIYKQVDMVFVGLNGYAQTPQWFDNYDNIYYEHFDNSLGDAVKFYWADWMKHAYYFALDDDLRITNPRYVEYMISKVDEYNGLVSLHGKTYLSPVHSYRQWAGNYRCLDEVSEDVHVNLIGSGCCCFKTSRLRVHIEDFHKKNMSDVWLSKIATEQGVPMMVLRHAKGEYLEYLYPQGSTIWRDTSDYSYHIEIMNKFIR